MLGSTRGENRTAAQTSKCVGAGWILAMGMLVIGSLLNGGIAFSRELAFVPSVRSVHDCDAVRNSLCGRWASGRAASPSSIICHRKAAGSRTLRLLLLRHTCPGYADLPGQPRRVVQKSASTRISNAGRCRGSFLDHALYLIAHGIRQVYLTVKSQIAFGLRGAFDAVRTWIRFLIDTRSTVGFAKSG